MNKTIGNKFLDLLSKSPDFYLQKGCEASPLHPSQGQQNSHFHTQKKEADLKGIKTENAHLTATSFGAYQIFSDIERPNITLPFPWLAGMIRNL